MKKMNIANEFDKEAYVECRQDIMQRNLMTLRQICTVGTVGGLVLVVISLLPFSFLSLIEGYTAIAVLFGAMLLLTNTLLKKHEALVLPTFYALIILVLSIGIIMGTFLSQKTNATTFIMLILCIPLFIVDKPYRLNLVIGTMCVIFCVIDVNVKSSYLSKVDIANCCVFFLLSLVIGRQSTYAKISDMIIKRELKKQLDIDMLTKLGNRSSFERIVEQYVHESNKGAIMIIMDVDNFKTVNDVMGHAYGDMVLQLVGEYLKGAFRKNDYVSRLGGDEFVVFLPAVTELEAIKEKLGKLIARIESIEIEAGKPVKISASIGIAQYPDDGCSFEMLYKRADKALYQAKENGKGHFVIYDAKTMSMEE